MRTIIVFSDLHSLFNPTFDYWKEFLSHLITTYPDAFILCLGDMDTLEDEVYQTYKNRILFLRGNNDFNQILEETKLDYTSYGVEILEKTGTGLLADSCTFRIEGLSFHAIHGHQVLNQRWKHPATRQEWITYRKALITERKNRGCDYLLYGHSHKYQFDSFHHLINPGCCNEILSDGPAGYIEIQIEKGRIKRIHHLVEKK
ncbi:MAG: metallophosphoesterase family protein [Firmicutes bacterium]|nr:metallophosphoesterase family protein [Bacillota bacterium]